jgi:hypothetical protein
MFVAWLMTISIFLICISTTYVIINGLKEKDHYELAQLQTQFLNVIPHKPEMKKAV